MKQFTGNCPESVCKAAKYHVKLENGVYVIGINYNTDNGEYWTPTTEKHPKLVKMVNDTKSEAGEPLGGSFYINEFRQVIVPVKDKYYLAGEYYELLSFAIQDDDGNDIIISGKAVDFHGNPLTPGDIWRGYLMGIPYTLSPKGDILFEIQLNPHHFRRIPLTKYYDQDVVKAFIQRLSRVIGHTFGGRFYINDVREMFKPISKNGYVEYIYLGKLEDEDPWFPKELFEKETD